MFNTTQFFYHKRLSEFMVAQTLYSLSDIKQTKLLLIQKRQFSLDLKVSLRFEAKEVLRYY